MEWYLLTGFAVVTISICTPLGLVKLFSVVGQVLVKPQFLRDLNEEFYTYSMEAETVRRRIKHVEATGESYISPPPMGPAPCGSPLSGENGSPGLDVKGGGPEGLLRQRNGALQMGLGEKLLELTHKREVVDGQRRASAFRRNILYPLAVLLLLLLTGIAVLMVLQNTLELLIGFKALPISTSQFTLGISSLSRLGPWGAGLQVVVLLYLCAASGIGLYRGALPPRLLPRKGRTPLTLLTANCALLLVFSSALPLLAKILGVTNFDLLGDFGSIEWLGNFKLVLLYNLVFAAAATLCLMNKFTATVRRELYNRFKFLVECVSPTDDNQLNHRSSTPMFNFNTRRSSLTNEWLKND